MGRCVIRLGSTWSCALGIDGGHQKQAQTRPGQSLSTGSAAVHSCGKRARAMSSRYSLAGMSAACLATGSLLYICFRPKSLLIFQWAEAIGAGGRVNVARNATRAVDHMMAGWITYSLPFALWVVSYMLAIGAVWGGSRSSARLIWLSIAPAMAIGSEVMQAAHLIPGTFDWRDLCFLVLASIVGLFAANCHASACDQRRESKKYRIGSSADSIHGACGRKRADSDGFRG